jgi:hypothetical protein
MLNPLSVVEMHVIPSRTFAPDDLALAEAWAQVAPSVRHVEARRCENGTEYVLLSTRSGAAEAEWLIWPDDDGVALEALSEEPSFASHATMSAALAAVSPLTHTQQVSAGLIAEAMLAYRQAGSPA